ncbi:T9SS type A sorting domain-containing protein [Pontibacter toksunensis]|uniref:T9SS type A sorting domain-containing protein n=1 Tax=Pontibacter toksunensis TaxID=1332631 RepID=A0ABW6BV11_9BACT
MKTFYISNPSLLRAKSATVALQRICCRIQKGTILLVLGMLLLSLNGFGQTIHSIKSGDWNDQSTWVVPSNGNSSTAANRIPNANDIVTIKQGHTVTVNTQESTCHTLTIEAGKTGNSPTGGRIYVGSTGAGKLTLIDLKFEIANGTPKQRAALQLGASGHLAVSGAISKISSVGQNQDVTSLDHSKILYNISSTSTIEYNGTNQSIFNFYAIAGNTDTESEASNRYGNLILSKPANSTGPVTKTPTTKVDGTTGLAIRGDLTVSSGVTFDALALNHTILKNLLNAGTIEARTSTINISENFTNNISTVTGIFNKGTGSVNYNGANQNAAGVAYHNLQFSGSGTKTATGGLSVASNLDIIPGITFNAGSGTHTIAANLTNTGTINAGTSTIKVGGLFSNPTGATFNKDTGTIEYNGNAQSITPLYYYNLVLTRSSGTTDAIKTAGGAIFVSNQFTLNTGASFAHNGSTFFYDGLVNQNITPVTYNNLTLAGSGTKSAIAALTLAGSLQTVPGVTFGATGNYTHTIALDVLNNGTINSAAITSANTLKVGRDVTNNGFFYAKDVEHTVSRNWTNDGTFEAGSSTILLNGTSKTITSTGTGAFNNLTVSNGTSSMTTDLTVNGALRVENTILETGAKTMILGPSANLLSAETATAHIRGNLQTTRNLAEGGTELFGRIGMRITNSSSSINNFTVKRVTGTAFENSSVQRHYNVTSPNAQATDKFTASVELAFPDFNLTEPVETAYEVYRKNLNSTYELLPKTETADSYYNYKLADAERKYGVYTLVNRNTPLPVELTWFKAQRQAQGVLLTWETASEKENKGFEVQTSTDGKNFSKIAFVESKVVNSSVTQRYSYTDKSATSVGIRYYRLAQVDLDGTTTFSNLKAVDMLTKVVAAAAYPNPFAEGQEVSVRLPQGGEKRLINVVLINMLGQVVDAQQVQMQDGETELSVSTAKANAKAVYLLNVIDNGTMHTFKLIKK